MTETLRCLICDEDFAPLPGTEEVPLNDAVGMWMADHVERHGGDPAKVGFIIHASGTIVRAQQ